jgi:hypothetical protein
MTARTPDDSGLGCSVVLVMLLAEAIWLSALGYGLAYLFG